MKYVINELEPELELLRQASRILASEMSRFDQAKDINRIVDEVQSCIELEALAMSDERRYQARRHVMKDSFLGAHDSEEDELKEVITN